MLKRQKYTKFAGMEKQQNETKPTGRKIQMCECDISKKH